MYFISIVLCTVVLLCIHIKVVVNCRPHAEIIDKKSKSVSNSPLYDDDDASISAVINNHIDNDNTPLSDNANFRNIQNTGESLDTSPDLTSIDQIFAEYSLFPSADGHDECILERSEFYLSWWVYENGTLRLPTLNRTAMSGFLDLSLQLATESMLYDFVLTFTSENPNEVSFKVSAACLEKKN